MGKAKVLFRTVRDQIARRIQDRLREQAPWAGQDRAQSPAAAS